MHWTGLSSYRRSPFFEYYEDLIYPFYHTEISYLLDYNIQYFEVIGKILDISLPFAFTQKYEDNELLSTKMIEDFRGLHHPHNDKNKVNFSYLSYLQVFSDRMPFMENLSILDLLFNRGPKSSNYLYECLKLNNYLKNFCYL